MLFTMVSADKTWDALWTFSQHTISEPWDSELRDNLQELAQHHCIVCFNIDEDKAW